MATTKIWPVRDNLKRVVDYAENHLKTANPEFYSKEELADLHSVLQYAANDSKTAMQHFVTGINCVDTLAYEQMTLTKRRFGKSGGNLAYHAYQSFKPDEVTPERCHEIGVELAKRIWGDRYEVVVSTHINTTCVHNHFVINSVSFVDGKKLNNNYAMYFGNLRRESDNICRQNGLSVIENPGTPTPGNIYLAERDGEPTRYNVMRADIDDCIQHSITKKQFGSYLRDRGYVINFDENRKYWTIAFKGDKRATRLERLGENYSNAVIQSRIAKNFLNKPVYFTTPQIKRFRMKGSLNRAKKITGFRALYLHYCYLLGIIPKRKEKRVPVSPQMRMELRKFERYKAEIVLLFRNNIDTIEQLNSFIEQKKAEIYRCEDERRKIYNKMRSAPPENIQALRTDRDTASERIKLIRRELFYCRDILENSEKLRGNIALERTILYHPLKQHEKQKTKFRERER